MQTPYFLINKTELDTNLNKLKDALNKYWVNSIIGYSYKTNSLPWIINYFNRQGCFAEVVSSDEYDLAKKVVKSNNCIIYNGPIKTKGTFIEALNSGCIINLDSKREIQWLESVDNSKSYSIGLRVNFDIERYCPGQSACGDEGGRFGFCLENGEFGKAISKIKEYGIKVVGLHLHVSSKTRSLEIYQAIAQVAVQIKDLYDLDLKFIDLGGGFFGGLDDKPQFDEYIKVISEILKTKYNPSNITLIVEPGMALIGSPISLVTSVIDIKDTTRNRFVVTDGSRIFIDPLMRKTSYFYALEQVKKSNVILPKQIICGFTCMENDRLFIARECPEINCDDKITYNKVGAYTMCLSPLFIKYFPPVYLNDNGKISLLREQWGVSEYVSKCRMEIY